MIPKYRNKFPRPSKIIFLFVIWVDTSCIIKTDQTSCNLNHNLKGNNSIFLGSGLIHVCHKSELFRVLLAYLRLEEGGPESKVKKYTCCTNTSKPYWIPCYIQCINVSENVFYMYGFLSLWLKYQLILCMLFSFKHFLRNSLSEDTFFDYKHLLIYHLGLSCSLFFPFQSFEYW